MLIITQLTVRSHSHHHTACHKTEVMSIIVWWKSRLRIYAHLYCCLWAYFFFQQVEECKIKTSRDLSINYRLVFILLIKAVDICSFVPPLVGIFLCPTSRRVQNKNFKRFVFLFGWKSQPDYDHWWRHLQPLVEVLQANTSNSSRGQHKRWTSFSAPPPPKTKNLPQGDNSTKGEHHFHNYPLPNLPKGDNHFHNFPLPNMPQGVNSTKGEHHFHNPRTHPPSKLDPRW